MATLSFFLRNPKTKKETSIYYYWSLGRGLRLRGTTPFKIKPKYWNEIDQKVRRIAEISAISDNINSWLKNFDAFIAEKLTDLKAKNVENEVLIKLIKDEIDVHLHKKLVFKNEVITFYPFVEKFIKQSKSRNNEKTGKLISTRTIQDYETTLQHLKDFEEKEKYSISFETINLEFYYAFKDYLEDLDYALNTIGKYFKVIKIFMNEATEQGVNTNLTYKTKRFIKPNEVSEQIYLSEKELDKIIKLDLTADKELDQVRDLFLIGAYTGLRISDFNGLTKDNIHTHQKIRVFKILVKKTGKYLPIPIHPIVESILAKRRGNPPEKMNNQKINDSMQVIGEKAKINDLITTTQTKGGKIITTKVPKYQMIKSHTARRSFCTNAYISGMSTLDIMAISGHSSEKSFLNYIKISADERAIKISECQFFKPNLIDEKNEKK